MLGQSLEEKNLLDNDADIFSCSPYRKTVYKSNYIEFTDVTLVHARVIRQRFRKEDKKEAFETVLDALRLYQDIERGDTNWIIATFAGHRMRPALAILEMALNDPDPIGTILLHQVRDEISQLIETAPHPATHFAGEIFEYYMRYSIPDTGKMQWREPSHWHLNTETKGDKMDPEVLDIPSTAFSTHADEPGRYFAALEEMGNRIQGACPPSIYPHSCLENLKVLFSSFPKPPRKGFWEYVEAYIDLFIHGLDKTINQKLVKVISHGLLEIVNLDQLARHEQIVFYLAALRLMVDYRILAEEEGSCPNPDVLSGVQFRQHRIDPYTGKEIRIINKHEGMFFIQSPTPAGKVAADRLFDDLELPESLAPTQRLKETAFIVVKCNLDSGTPNLQTVIQ